MTERVIRANLIGGAAVALVALSITGCGAGRTASHGVAGVQTTIHHVRHCAGLRRSVGSPDAAWAAVLLRRTSIHATPGGRALKHFARVNVNGVATVFSVLGEQLDGRCRPAWFHVELPVRPNGATGWVRASAVQHAVVHTRIVIDLSQRRLWLYRRGRVVFTSPTAVGTTATPTPVGRYYVSERLIPANPNGPWGPYALGTSAYSPVLRGWTQGGPIGIHGTNEPWSIGHAASNGCIRLPNAAVTKLFRQTLAGTPVFIRR
jgi:hypothetical protein